ncbi:MAG: hypothetical protein IJM09_03245 [Neisseriaceae bacterium]|nr:hypothetical protein [Neisseriaceae bacterium]
MFKNINNLTLVVMATLTLTACADIMYSLGLDGKKTTPKPQASNSATQPVQSAQPKSFLPQRDEQPINTVRSQRNVFDAAQCLVQHIQSDFNLPENFYQAIGYDDGAATVALVNPNTGKNGLYIDIVPNNNGSQLLLYQNRATISTLWRKLPEKCR